LKDAIKLLGHAKLNAIGILMVDYEGCEWTIVSQWPDSDIPKIMQLLVELHNTQYNFGCIIVNNEIS
jgi:hypothetical protein